MRATGSTATAGTRSDDAAAKLATSRTLEFFREAPFLRQTKQIITKTEVVTENGMATAMHPLAAEAGSGESYAPAGAPPTER